MLNPFTDRLALITAALAAAACSVVDVATPQAAAADRPNIVILISDDQTYHDVGCYGNEQVNTPHIDRLASQGMRFTHCFTATAMCAPTRQQLYTGLFPVRNGAYPNHSKVYPGTKSVVHHFKALGYRVALAGKKHFGPPDSFPFEHLGGKHHDDGGLKSGPEFNVDKAKQFMQRDADQPYLLVFASNQPHLPWNRGDASQYDAAKLKLPPYLVDTPQTREALVKYYAEITYFDDQVGRFMALIEQTGAADNTIVIYTSEQGAQLPHGKWTCYDTGLRTALVVRWPGRVQPGAVTDAMVQYVDIVPTLIEATGGDPTKIDTGRDGAPDGAAHPRGFDGRSFLPVLEGKTDQHRDHTFGVHTTRGIINGSESYPIRSVRSRTHKLIWNLNHEAAFRNIVMSDKRQDAYWPSWLARAATDAAAKRLVGAYQHRPEFELYDLRSDPYELRNLADEASSAPIQAALLTELKAWMTQQGDKGQDTEMQAKQRQGRDK